MSLIHTHPHIARLSLLFVTAAILFLAGGAIYPALAQDQGGNPPPADQNPPPQPPKEGGLDVDVDINTPPSSPIWYAQWWMWAVGLGVFLIVVISLTRGGRRTA
jgi:hypothetical protein